MNNKVIGMYFSPTGGTKKIVEAAAYAASETAEMIDLTKLPERLQPLSFNETDYVIMGVPVYGGRIPKLMEEYFQTISGIDTPLVCIAVYGNRDYDDALLEMKELLESNGFRCHAGAAFIGEHSYTDKVAGGRPDMEDIESVKAFSRTAWTNYTQKTGDTGSLTVKGNHPYKERRPMEPMSPVTTDECIFCGLCSESCPVEAIDFEDYHAVNSKKCIKCCACIKVCPKKAKQFDHPMIDKIVEMLIATCSEERKSPEYFY